VPAQGEDSPCGADIGDELRGLSVTYLAKDFLDVISVGDEETIADIEPRVSELSRKTTCPRDGREGAAFVDVARDPHAAKANFMLSYTWRYGVCSVISALINFCQLRRLDTGSVRVWICMLCVNQHRVKESRQKGEAVPFETFRDTFTDKVVTIGHILALMTPWHDAGYLKRLWCFPRICRPYSNMTADTV